MIAPSFAPVIAFWSPGPGEMFLLLVIALLLYGGDLPEKAREWGKMFAEFRRGLSGVQDELKTAVYTDSPKPQRLQHYPEFRDVEPLDSATDNAESSSASGDDAPDPARDGIPND